eukprot:PhM_4_TR15490/c2_g1_i1/m.5009
MKSSSSFRNPLSSMWHILYTSNVKPNDDYFTRRRKLCVAGVMIVLVVFTTGIAGMLWSYFTDEIDLWYLLMYCAPIIFTGTCEVLLWAWMRRTRETTDRFMTVWFACQFAGMFWMTQIVPSAPWQTTLICCGAFLHGTNVKDSVLHAIIALLYLLTSFNDSVGRETGWYLSFVHLEIQGVQHAISFQIFILGVMACTTLLLHQEVVEFRRLLCRSETTVLLAQRVSELLLTYDTDAAMRVLDDDDDATKDDEVRDLMASTLRQIVSNMQTYRPFLPNYVLRVGDDDDDDDDLADTATSLANMDIPTSDTEDSPQYSNFTMPKEAAVVPSLPPHHLSLQTCSVSSSTSESIERTLSTSLSMSNSHIMSVENIPSAALTTSLGMSGQRPRISVRATLATVMLTISQLRRGGSGGIDVNDPLGTGVDAFSEMCDNARATVHGFFGDLVHLSWNTARRVTQHETRALHLVLGLRADFTPTAAVTSGLVDFTLCGTRQVVPIIGVPWQRRLEDMHRLYAQRLSIPVACSATVAQANHAVYTIRFGVIQPRRRSQQQQQQPLRSPAPGRGASATTNTATTTSTIPEALLRSIGTESTGSAPSSPASAPPHSPPLLAAGGLFVHEVVSERVEGEAAEEWMYNLEARDTDDPYAAVGRAAEELSRGDALAASAALNSFLEHAPQEMGKRACVEYLRHAVEKAVRRQQHQHQQEQQ